VIRPWRLWTSSASQRCNGRRQAISLWAYRSAWSFLLLDEPAAGLNTSETQELAHLLCSICDRFKLTILLVEHDMGLVMSICDTITVLNFGQKIAEGTPFEVQNNPEVIKAYLGETVGAEQP
jgi:branched-chain amino acid transport system ATP-binding protein